MHKQSAMHPIFMKSQIKRCIQFAKCISIESFFPKSDASIPPNASQSITYLKKEMHASRIMHRNQPNIPKKRCIHPAKCIAIDHLSQKRDACFKNNASQSAQHPENTMHPPHQHPTKRAIPPSETAPQVKFAQPYQRPYLLFVTSSSSWPLRYLSPFLIRSLIV